MPNRIVREAILSSSAVCSLAWPEEVFYRRLMNIADDYGRCEALPQLLRAKCYPLQTDLVRVADITRWMAACQNAGLIVHYEVAGKQYLEIVKFGQQQRSKSKFPGPTSLDSKCSQEISDAHLGVFVVEDVVVEAPTVLVDRNAANPGPYRVPDCPYEAIIEAFHERLSMLSRVTVLNDARRQHIRSRWREVCASEKFSSQQGEEWFVWFFDRVASSSFLTGKSRAKPGHEPFRATLDWLMLPTNFAKVVDGNYDGKAAA